MDVNIFLKILLKNVNRKINWHTLLKDEYKFLGYREEKGKNMSENWMIVKGEGVEGITEKENKINS